jgi:hypothetical protein
MTISHGPTEPFPYPSSISVSGTSVVILRWPSEEGFRGALHALGQPRILILDEGAAPPEILDAAEDWMRYPPDAGELLLRAQHVAQRSGEGEQRRLELDDVGIASRGDRWVALSDGQIPLLRALLASPDRVIPFDTLATAYRDAGGSDHPASVRTALSRLHAKLEPLGVKVMAVRGRGAILVTRPMI